jgi:hypothetical protein
MFSRSTFDLPCKSSHRLCNIRSFHSGDYEECRLPGYKNPVRTSQETHYFSATEHSQLMPCKIWGFQGGDCEECRLLGYYACGSCNNQRFGGISFLTRAIRRKIPEDGILHLTDSSTLISNYPGQVHWAKYWPTFWVGLVSPSLWNRQLYSGENTMSSDRTYIKIKYCHVPGRVAWIIMRVFGLALGFIRLRIRLQ